RVRGHGRAAGAALLRRRLAEPLSRRAPAVARRHLALGEGRRARRAPARPAEARRDPRAVARARMKRLTPEPTAEAPSAAYDGVHVAVRDLLGDELADLRFRVLAGDHKLDNKIENPRGQKPGLPF